MSVLKKNIPIIILMILLVWSTKLCQTPFRQITPDEVERWKNDLQPAYFKGKVRFFGFPDNGSRLNGSIYMTLLDSSNLVIPIECEYLKFKKKYLVLDAIHMNITAGLQRIMWGDIIEKHTGSDTLYLFNKEGKLKYYFFLFDGMAGPMRMPD